MAYDEVERCPHCHEWMHYKEVRKHLGRRRGRHWCWLFHRVCHHPWPPEAWPWPDCPHCARRRG